jgi:hypothetical protein
LRAWFFPPDRRAFFVVNGTGIEVEKASGGKKASKKLCYKA